MRFAGWLWGGCTLVGLSFAACSDHEPSIAPGAGGSGGEGGAAEGGTSAVCLPEDCPQPDGECQHAFCEGAACAIGNVAEGLSCAAGVCDGKGSCVRCIDAEDCGAGEICEQNDCLVDPCANRSWDGDETDLDCGGSCAPCGVGLTCMAPSDCVSGVCEGDTCACSPALAVQDDGSAVHGAVGLPDLVLSEIRPGAYLELYNTTESALALAGVSHQLHSAPTSEALATLGAGITVPPLGYAVVPWPSSFSDTAAGGELLLYADTSVEDDTKILDFVCWGENPHDTRKGGAGSVGKWSGDCAPAAAAGSVHRLVGTTGVSSPDYDVNSAQTAMSCAGS